MNKLSKEKNENKKFIPKIKRNIKNLKSLNQLKKRKKLEIIN